MKQDRSRKILGGIEEDKETSANVRNKEKYQKGPWTGTGEFLL